MNRSLSSEPQLSLTRYFEVKRNMHIHDRKLRDIQSTFTSRERRYEPSNVKRQPFGEMNRMFTVDIENQSLLRKLTNRSESKISKDKPFQLLKVPRRNILEERKKSMENLALLKRIKEAKPSYQKNKMLSDRKTTETYLNTISRFGYKGYTPTKTILPPFFDKEIQKHNYIKDEVDALSQTSRNDNESEDFDTKCFEKRRKKTEKPIKTKESIHNENGYEKIEKIEVKFLSFEGIAIQITYIVWNEKVTLNAEVDGEGTIHLQITKKWFDTAFESNVEFLHEHVKYNKRLAKIEIDNPPPQKAKHTDMNQIR